MSGPPFASLKIQWCCMKFVVEVPDQEVYEAAERPEDLASEIAEVITNEIFDFTSLTVVSQPSQVTK